MTNKTNRGGPGRGQGRKPLAIGEETIPVTIRMTQTQAAQFKLLGGPKWMRAQIDKSDRESGHFTGTSS